MQFGYQMNAYYWGWDRSVDLRVDCAVDLAYDDLEWSPECRHWIWYLDSAAEADMLYKQLRCIQGLTIDLVRYENAHEQVVIH